MILFDFKEFFKYFFKANRIYIKRAELNIFHICKFLYLQNYSSNDINIYEV